MNFRVIIDGRIELLANFKNGHPVVGEEVWVTMPNATIGARVKKLNVQLGLMALESWFHHGDYRIDHYQAAKAVGSPRFAK